MTVSFSGSLKTRTGFSQPRVHTVMSKDECPQGTSPSHNCMNEWLGEPVPVSQLPGRGILRIYINNLAIKGVFVDKIECILNISWENKKVPMVYHQDFFVFPRENKKVLVMPCLCKNQHWENKKVLVIHHEDFFVFPNIFRH